MLSAAKHLPGLCATAAAFGLSTRRPTQAHSWLRLMPITADSSALSLDFLISQLGAIHTLLLRKAGQQYYNWTMPLERLEAGGMCRRLQKAPTGRVGEGRGLRADCGLLEVPTESDLGTNGIERPGQLVRVQISVILLVVEAYHLLQERNVVDRVDHSLDDHHFVPTLQMECDR